MIRKALLASALLCCASLPASADFAFTAGSGLTAHSFVTATGGTAACATVHCFASVPIDTAGDQLFATGNAGYVRFPSAQAVTMTSTTITGTVAATQSGTWGLTTWAGSTLGAITTYGTSPGAVLAPSVNAFVTNATALGQAVMASSSPVTIASNQSANALWGHVATGSAPPSGSTYVGALTGGATGGLVQGIIQCSNSVIYDASTNGSTELVALSSGRSIYVCGYSILAGGTVNVKLIYGTGTACATGSNNMTPAFQLTAQVGLVDSSTFVRGLKTAASNALCINTSAGVATQAIVYYSQI